MTTTMACGLSGMAAELCIIMSLRKFSVSYRFKSSVPSARVPVYALVIQVQCPIPTPADSMSFAVCCVSLYPKTPKIKSQTP